MLEICLGNEELLRSKYFVLVFIAKLFGLLENILNFSKVAQLKLRIGKPHMRIEVVFVHLEYFFIDLSCTIPSGLPF
jgi:hypothetical protein